MASQSLDITLKLSSDSNINGILTLNTTENDTLTFDDSEVIAKTVTAAAGAQTEIVPTSAADTYVYIKNTDVTNFLQVQTVANHNYAKIFPGEFIFICIDNPVGMEVVANTGDIVVEYVTFKKG